MRNIRINFEHPSYLYPFRLNLAPQLSPLELERLNPNALVEEIGHLKQ
jgi:hypothetical protein